MSIKHLTAAQLMTVQPVVIESSQSLRAAARVMLERNIHCLLVLGQSGQLPGIITSKDIVPVLCDGETELLDQLRVADAVTTPAISVQHDFSIVDCLRLMRMSGVRSVPVLENLRAVGILSFTDVLRAATAAPVH
jgi:CBS domain-containing protein